MLHPSQAGGGAVVFFLSIGISLKQCAQPFPVDVVVTAQLRTHSTVQNPSSHYILQGTLEIVLANTNANANTQKYMEIP